MTLSRHCYTRPIEPRTASIVRYLEPHGPGAAGLQHLHGGIEGRPHLGGGAVEEEVGGNANPQPPHVPIECSFVGTGSVEDVGSAASWPAMMHSRRAQSRAARASGPTLSAEKESGMAP